MMLKFPQRFIIGSSTAAYQTEGNNVSSDFWAEEYAKGSPYKDKSGDAINHYHLFREDIALMASLGLKAYRFSIEWSRIEPEEGQFSNVAMEHYREVLECCYEYGITPVVSMHHFSSPKWLMRLGGWKNPDVVKYFSRYCKTVFDTIGHLIPYVLTLNEVNLPVMLREVFTQIGFIPPVGVTREAWIAPKWRESAAKLCGTTIENYFTFHMISDESTIAILKEVHREARATICAIQPNTKIGFSMALPDVQSLPGGEKLAKEKWELYFRQFKDMLLEDDFFGLQNYTQEVYGPTGQVKPSDETKLTQMGYEYAPQALERVIQKVAKEITIPIMVTEHGIATDDDQQRITFMEQGLKGILNCIASGIDVLGYLHWTTFDNFEWSAGYSMSFGLIGVDRITFERKPKGSAIHLGKVAKEHGLLESTQMNTILEEGVGNED